MKQIVIIVCLFFCVSCAGRSPIHTEYRVYVDKIEIVENYYGTFYRIYIDQERTCPIIVNVGDVEVGKRYRIKFIEVR